MAEPTSSAAIIAATAAGLTLFGVATGLHSGILLAGLAGGLWALSYLPPMLWWQRTLVAFIGALIAGWATPPVALGLTSFAWWPKPVTPEIIQFPIAVAIGLLAHTVIGPALIRIARAKAQDAAK